MLATFGLGRVETSIDDRDTDDEVAELIERVTAIPLPAPPSRRLLHPRVVIDDEPHLPTRLCRHL
jgi:hypothetical protein